MPFDAEKFCKDYKIKCYTEGENVTPGWINIRCPMCDDPKNHGGINPKNGAYSCWICGKHKLNHIIKVLTKKEYNEVYYIRKKYTHGDIITKREKRDPKDIPSEVIFPSDTGLLNQSARNYLISRSFNPDEIIREWGIKSTSHIGKYKHRILAPIYFENQLVSFQTRDITNKQTRYLPCEKEKEIIPFKETIYGYDKAINNKRCIVVEGITDVWRLGPGAVGLYGKDYTEFQVRILANNFDLIFIMLDPEYQAQEKALLLRDSIYLSSSKIEVDIIEMDHGDPGDMSNQEAKYWMKELGI